MILLILGPEYSTDQKYIFKKCCFGTKEKKKKKKKGGHSTKISLKRLILLSGIRKLNL